MTDQRKFIEESDRFSASGDSHDLPEIANWFSRNILSHELIKHTGSNSFQELVLEEIRNSRKANSEFVLVSLGAGHGQIEIDLLKMVQSISPGNTHFHAIDLFSPNDTVETKADGSTYRLTRVSQDLNKPDFPRNADMIIVHHALHHFVALEKIFEAIHEILLANSGTIVIADMIGRNGHMRWPESLRAINRIWEALPEEKKYNNQFNKTWHSFENWDCSGEGFEGIRSEDILKPLIKFFESAGSFFWGGVLDPFIDRGFGSNFDPKNHKDIEIITRVLEVETKLQEFGYLTATQVIGKFRPRKEPLVSSFTNFLISKKYHGELLPNVKLHIDEIVDSYFDRSERVPPVIVSDNALSNRNLKKYMLNGWDISDPSLTWGVGLESRLEFSFNEVLLSSIQLDCYLLKRAKYGEVQILINSSILQAQQLTSSTIFHLPPITISTIEILFKFTEIDNSIDVEDRRLITFYLSNLSFYPRSDGELGVLVTHPRRLAIQRLKLRVYFAKKLRPILPRKVKTILKSLYIRLIDGL